MYLTLCLNQALMFPHLCFEYIFPGIHGKKSYSKGDELQLKQTLVKERTMKATMKLITCQRAHYYRRGTGLTRSGQKRKQRRHLSFNEALSWCWGDIRGPLSCPLYPFLLCLVTGVVPLVLTSRLFSCPLIKS